MSDEILNDLLSEAQELIEALSKDLSVFEKAVNSRKKIDPGLVNEIFRKAHTLKGVTGFAGLQTMGKLTHCMETLLDKIRLGKVQVNQEVINILFETVEILELLLTTNSSQVGGQVTVIMQRLEDVYKAKSDVSKPGKTPTSIKIPQDIQETLTEYNEFRLKANLKENINVVVVVARFPMNDFDKLLPQVKKALSRFGEVIASIPLMDSENPDKMVFKLVYATKVRMKKMKTVLKQKGYGLIVINEMDSNIQEN